MNKIKKKNLEAISIQLRPLRESDYSNEYLSWLEDQEINIDIINNGDGSFTVKFFTNGLGSEVLEEAEFSTRTGASGFGGSDAIVLSGISDSDNTTNWTGTTHPIVKCNERSPKSLNAFDNKTLEQVASMYGEPEETGSLAVSSNKIGSGGHTGYCTYKVDENGYAEKDDDGNMVSANVTGNEVTSDECDTARGQWIDLTNETDPNKGRVGVASCNLERGTITPEAVNAETGQPNESLPNSSSNYTIAQPTGESPEGQSLEWTKQPYKVSHCQRSICQYPKVNMAPGDVAEGSDAAGDPATLGYKYIGRGSENNTDSIANVLGYESGGTGDVSFPSPVPQAVAFGSRMEGGGIVDAGTKYLRGRTTSTHEPYKELNETPTGRTEIPDQIKRDQFFNDTSIYRDKHGASLQCDNTNFSGTPNLKCTQTSDQYLSNATPKFSSFSGCYENSCVIPSPSALESDPQSWSSQMYNDATRAEKEKWDRVERGYEFKKGDVYTKVQQTGLPFESSKLKKGNPNGTAGLDTDPKHDDAPIDFKCNRNFRANSSSPKKIRCPSKDPSGLQPYWVNTDATGNYGNWLPNTSDGTLPSETNFSSQYGVFTNLYSKHGLNSLDEHVPDPNDPLSGKVGGLNTNEDPIVNSAQCVENKCLIDDSTLDAPPLAGETPDDGDLGGDVLFELRRQCTGEGTTGAETTEGDCSGTWNAKNERERLHPEVEGYEFRLYNNQQGDTPSERSTAGPAKLGYCSGSNGSAETTAGEENTATECTANGGTWNPYKLWEQHDVFTSGDGSTSLSEAEPATSKDRGFIGYHINPNTGNSVVHTELYKHVDSNPSPDDQMKVTAHYLSPLQDYGASSQTDSRSESHTIRCAPNFHVSKNRDQRDSFKTGDAAEVGRPESDHMRGRSEDGKGPLVTCEGSSDTSDAANAAGTTKFTLSGCSENYCKLPNESNRNTSMYTYTDNKKTELENLAENQNGKLTLRQFNFGSESPTLKCAPWTKGTPHVACNWGGLESTGRSATAGTCSVEQTDSITGRKIPYLTREKCEKANGVWTPEQTRVDMTEARKADGDVPEFTFTGCVPLVRQEPEGTTYYEPYPGDCVGYWPGSLSHISDNGSGQTISPPDLPDEQSRDTAMFRFYNQCKRNCDNNLKCSGFTIQKLGRDEAAASGADEGTMVCNQKTSRAPGGITANAGPPDQQCRLETRSQSSWAKNWGYDNIFKDFEMDPTAAAQMGLINSATDAAPKVTTVRWQIIPDDQPIYFEKKYTPGVNTEILNAGRGPDQQFPADSLSVTPDVSGSGTPQDQTPSSLRNPPTASATAGNTIGGSGTTVGEGGVEVETGGGIAR